MKGIKILTDGKMELVEIPEDSDKSYDVMQKAVEGWIEMVNPVRLSREYVMVCNEEARLIPLPYNKHASYLYGYDTHNQMVCGNVLILKNSVRITDGIEENDIVGMNDEDAKKMMEFLKEKQREAENSLLMAPPSRQQIQNPEITISTFEDEDALNVLFAAGTKKEYSSNADEDALNVVFASGKEAFEDKIDNAIRNEERKEAKENGNA